MVSHRITLRGTGGSTQTIRGHELDVSEAAVTSIIVQLETQPADIVTSPTLRQRVTGMQLGGVGCSGLSLEFPPGMVPSNQSMQAGGNGDHGLHNRINIDFDTNSRTHVMRDVMYLSNVQIPSTYEIKVYYADAPDTLVSDATLAAIRSIQLNMRCNVRNLLIN